MVAVREPMAPLEVEKRTTPQLAAPVAPRSLNPAENERLRPYQDYGAQFELAFSSQAKGEYQKAIHHYTKAIELRPKDADAYINRAAAYENTGDLVMALRDINTALDLDPRVEAYNNRGNIYFKQDNYRRAVEDYGKSIELDPGNIGAYIYRAHALRYLAFFDDAIRGYRAALALSPNNASAYVGIGLVHQLRGEFDNAIECFDQALKSDSGDPYIYLNRGASSIAKGDIDSAERDFEKALELDPLYPYAFVTRSLVLMNKGDVDGALRDLDRALELNPEYAYPRSLRGSLYLQRGDPDRAIQDLDKALALDPNNSDAYNNRGFAYELRGDLARAMQDYNRSIRTRLNMTAYANRGIVLLRQSKWDEARSDLRSARNMGKDLVSFFRERHESVAAFEEKQKLELPQDIAEMISMDEAPESSITSESVLEVFRKARESLPDTAFDDLPPDGSRNYRHCLYGWPKE